MTACKFCDLDAKQPELVIRQTARWSLLHVDEFWPDGAVYLVCRGHALLPELTAADWTEAGPLIAAASQMVSELCQAQRVYLGAFSELNEHFHLLIMPKRPEDSAAHGNKRGPTLMTAMVVANRPFDPGQVDRRVKQYRTALDTYLARG